MALVFHSGFESGNTLEWTSVIGTPSVIKGALSYIGQTASYEGIIWAIWGDDTHIYVSGGTTFTVRKYLKSDLSYIGETASYGDVIRTVWGDDTHIYFGGWTTNRVRKCLKSDLSYVGQTASFGGTAFSIWGDDTHFYVGIGAVTSTVRKYLKSDLSYIGQTADFGNIVRAVWGDTTHIYAGGDTNIVKKYLKSDLSYIGETVNFTSAVSGLWGDDTHIYAGIGATAGTVKKCLKSDLSYISETASYGGIIRTTWGDAAYIYAGGETTLTVRKYLKSDLSYICESPSYGGIIYAIWGDATHIYAGGATTLTARKYSNVLPKTGTYAMRCNTEAATAYVINILVAHQSSFYLYIAVAPSAITTILAGRTNLNYERSLEIRLNTDRTLHLREFTNTADGTTVLALNTWYRISVTIDAATPSFARLFIDGVSELATPLSVTDGTFTFAWLGVVESVIADLYFDDVAVDGDYSTADLGDIRTLLSLPNAAGQYSDFDTVVPSGATHYTTYDDLPGAISDADYVQQAGKTAVRDTAGLQDCATIGIGASDILQAVNVLNRMKGATDCGISVRDNATDYNYAKPLNKTIAWFSQYFAQAPSGPTAWTQDRFNAFQAGAFHAYNQGTDTFLYALMVMVAYIPAAVEAAWKKLLFTSEPPTPNAWNQLSLDAGTGWKKLNY